MRWRVTGRIDGGVGGAQRRVGHHPVAHVQPCLLGQPGLRDGTDADDHRVRVDRGAVREMCRGRLPVAGGDLGDPDAEPQVDAVLAVQPGEHRGDLRAEDVQQRQVRRFQDGNVHSGGAAQWVAVRP
jgi:hypothetical protein